MCDIVDDLDSNRDLVFEAFELPEEILDETYGEGKWTVRYLLHHIVDAETVLYERIRRIIAEPRPVLWAFDQDLWAENLHYKTKSLELSKELFKVVREHIIYLAELHYDDDGGREYVHSEDGVRTLADEFEKVIWHAEDHLDRIQEVIDLYKEND